MSSRERLLNRRRHEVSEFIHGRVRFALGVGFFPNGHPAETFITAPQVIGSETEAIARDGAILISLALQHGCDLATIEHALTRDSDGRPATVLGAALDALFAQSEGAA
jgi:hypothetical protein